MHVPSPFATATSIRDFGSYLPIELGSHELDRSEHSTAVDRWQALQKMPLSHLVEDREFFGNQMWDSSVYEIQLSPESVRLTLDHEDTRVFARVLCELLQAPRRPSPFPVDLIMHDPICVRAVAHDSKGKLFDVDLESRVSESGDPIGDMGNEWFYPHAEGLGWVVELYNVTPAPTILDFQVHLLVECARASAVDRRLHALVAAFGPPVALLWNETLARFHREGETRLAIENDIWDFLEARLAAHRLTRQSFTLE
ncbi:MAG: hypothetical protein ACO1SV_12155 [Fimbriimonas sp.]